MTAIESNELSIIIPAKNEARPLRALLPRLRSLFPQAQITVVNDGSVDETAEVCESAGINVIHHPYSLGNGAAIKSGIRAATKPIVVVMDGDGQHSPDDITILLDKMSSGYDMVVGARTASGQSNIPRRVANHIYNRIASWMVGQKVADLTSGFRVASREKFVEFLPLLPNGFSYPTTITMAFFRAGHAVGYQSINVSKREGKSHIRPFRDGARFLLIIFRVGTLYSPLKIFFPLGTLTFLLGLGYAAFTLSIMGRFTNMSATLLTTGIVVFLIGLVSEQITMLIYSRRT